MTEKPALCSYFGCNEPVLESEAIHDGHSMNFCAKHDAEFTAIVKAEPFNPALLMHFWIEASGGAERLSISILGGSDE